MFAQLRKHSGGALLGWVVLLLLIVGAAAVYFKLNPEDLPGWASRTAIGKDLQTTTVYKWKDASGAWQVTDQPPAAGIDYEVQSYVRDTNVLPLPPKLER
jgi:hypothetical protein